MSTPEPLNPRDIATLERAVKRYQSLGFEASLGITHEAQGRAAIWYVDPRRRSSDTFQLDIEKYAGGFGAAAWIIQIARSNGFLMTMTNVGQVSSNILLFALSDAERVIGGEKLPERKNPPAAREAPIKASRNELASLDKIAAALLTPEPSLTAAPGKSRSNRGPGRPSRARNAPVSGRSNSDPFASIRGQ
jgi:hypothetical protein